MTAFIEKEWKNTRAYKKQTNKEAHKNPTKEKSFQLGKILTRTQWQTAIETEAQREIWNLSKDQTSVGPLSTPLKHYIVSLSPKIPQQMGERIQDQTLQRSLC